MLQRSEVDGPLGGLGLVRQAVRHAEGDNFVWALTSALAGAEGGTPQQQYTSLLANMQEVVRLESAKAAQAAEVDWTNPDARQCTAASIAMKRDLLILSEVDGKYSSTAVLYRGATMEGTCRPPFLGGRRESLRPWFW
jgi:hypothetical protein